MRLFLSVILLSLPGMLSAQSLGEARGMVFELIQMIEDDEPDADMYDQLSSFVAIERTISHFTSARLQQQLRMRLQNEGLQALRQHFRRIASEPGSIRWSLETWRYRNEMLEQWRMNRWQATDHQLPSLAQEMMDLDVRFYRIGYCGLTHLDTNVPARLKLAATVAFGEGGYKVRDVAVEIAEDESLNEPCTVDFDASLLSSLNNLLSATIHEGWLVQ